MFDSFVAEVMCSGGGQPPHRSDLDMQTHLRDDADGSSLRIGFTFDPVDVEQENILESGYLLVAEPRASERIRLAGIWHCRVCESEQWAVVEIVDRCIEQISPIVLNRQTLDSINYISQISAEFLAGFTSEAHGEPANVVEILRQRLP